MKKLGIPSHSANERLALSFAPQQPFSNHKPCHILFVLNVSAPRNFLVHNMEDTEEAELLKDLQSRADSLLREVRSFQAHLEQHQKQNEVEIRAFKRGIEAEVKAMTKLNHILTKSHFDENNNEDEESSQLHVLRSSNLPFYESVWEVAKSCRGVTALSKRMCDAVNPAIVTHAHNQKSVTQSSVPTGRFKKGVWVDIVAEGGLEWIKVSTLSEKRLLFEMAKEGWEKYEVSGDSSATDSDGEGLQEADTRVGKLELVRLAEDLGSAAKGDRVHFRHPQIRIVLPNIREDVVEDVDAFLADLRSTGAVVQCSNDWNEVIPGTNLDLDKMMPTFAIKPLTSTLNIDCTILLALVSDISHLSREQLSPIPNPKGYHGYKAIMTQIADEERAPILRDDLYPLLVGRTLECTSHAAQRMREIVETMGTTTERKRADVLLGEGQYQDQTVSNLQHAFRETSVHSVPDTIQFPVRVVVVNVEELLSSEGDMATTSAHFCRGFPSSVAAKAKDSVRLSAINASVLLYGWKRQTTTLTSNRAIVSGLMKAINNILDSDERQGHKYDADFVGPLIHISEPARSLMGKTKSGQPKRGT